MYFFVRSDTHQVVGHSGMVSAGGRLVTVELDLASRVVAHNTGVQESLLLPWLVPDYQTAEALTQARRLTATVESDVVISIAVDEAAPATEPASQAESDTEEIKQLVRNNLLASEHDRRWLTQKEAAKRLGIPWLKAHPDAHQDELEDAIGQALTLEFPGAPLVINCGGLIASYAAGAFARGLIAAASFEALRDLVAATGEQELQRLLAQL